MSQNFPMGLRSTPPNCHGPHVPPQQCRWQEHPRHSSHNEAIKIMKLKRILDYSESRPMASDAAIAIIIGSIPKSLVLDTDVNIISDIFLQTVYQRQQYTSKTLPKSI